MQAPYPASHRSLLALIIPRFGSRIYLPDNCLSVSRAIQLAGELVPHAEETLAVTNPLGAKPLIIEMFEAEITPNLRGVEFFPITHRFVKRHFTYGYPYNAVARRLSWRNPGALRRSWY